MSSDDENDNQRPKLAAATLRQSIAEKEAAKVEAALKKREEADRELQRIFRESLEEQITQQELDDIRQKILREPSEVSWRFWCCSFPPSCAPTEAAPSTMAIQGGWKRFRARPRAFTISFSSEGDPRASG